MAKIISITAREIKDSREKPTIETTVETEKGEFLACVPSGASTGAREALELRDADGLGVSLAIKNVNEIIAPKLKGMNPENQAEIDRTMIELDGTENKSKLGANAILSVSMAVARAGAASKKMPLYRHIKDLCNLDSRFRGNDTDDGAKFKIPLPMFNILEGGVHTDRETELCLQETMVVPQKKTIQENLAVCNKIFNNLKKVMKDSFQTEPKMGFEGGFEALFSKVEQALYSVKSAIGNEGAKIALDFAASEFYSNGKYNYDGRELTRAELLEIYSALIKSFPIISIEDGFAEEDWEGWKSFVQQEGNNIIIIGDDLTTTNIKTIKEAHNHLAINGVLIKLNQIGSVTETIEAINMTKSFGWKVIVSHRSGETMDDFIADLAVGAGADFLKAGSPAKPERMVKYMRIVEIENELHK